MIGDAENLSQSLSISVNHPPIFGVAAQKLAFCPSFWCFKKAGDGSSIPGYIHLQKKKNKKVVFVGCSELIFVIVSFRNSGLTPVYTPTSLSLSLSLTIWPKAYWPIAPIVLHEWISTFSLAFKRVTGKGWNEEREREKRRWTRTDSLPLIAKTVTETPETKRQGYAKFSLKGVAFFLSQICVTLFLFIRTPILSPALFSRRFQPKMLLSTS